jgi:hypothetical protein
MRPDNKTAKTRRGPAGKAQCQIQFIVQAIAPRQHRGIARLSIFFGEPWPKTAIENKGAWRADGNTNSPGKRSRAGNL